MNLASENMVETDILVIGGGIAGCFAAIKVKEQGLKVTIVDKAYAGKSGAGIATDIFWLVFNPEWGADFDVCMDTFIKSGEYINNRPWCEIILKDSWQIYQDMVSWGVEFPPDALEYVNYFPPFTGMRIKHRNPAPVLRNQAEKVGVKVLDRIMCTDLLKHDGKVAGAIGFSYDTGDLYIFKAKATVLTAGGSSFKTAAEMSMLTGDAEGMAFRAGAEITGKEFGSSTFPSFARYPSWGRAAHGQVNPAFPNIADGEGTVLGGVPAHLTEESRQEWSLGLESVVHDGRGPIFWDPTPATAEDTQRMMKWQTDTHSPQEVERAREIFDLSSPSKIQLSGGYAAGYSLVGASGIWVMDTKGATSLAGLYAAGDCGGTRYNGSYLTNPGLGACPAAITGRRAGMGAAEYALQEEEPVIDEAEIARLKNIMYTPIERRGGFSPRWVTQLLQNTMLPYFIIYIKHGGRLQAALTIVEFLRDHLLPKMVVKDAHELRLAHETKNMVLIAEMMLRASLFRTESRGLHYREDYPQRDDPAWLAWTKIKEEKGKMTVSKEPVPQEWWPDLSKSYEERYDLRFPGEQVN